MLQGDMPRADDSGETLSEMLRRLRLTAGLSQEALAARARLSVRTISDLERGVKQWPRPGTLQMLATALDLTSHEHATLIEAARRPSSPRSRAEIPRPRAASPQHWTAATSKIPEQPSSFVGRELEKREVIALLETHRLVTITGSGGIGKTRLALQVAREMVDSFPDGVRLVELAALEAASLVAQVVASGLGLQDRTDRDLTETIVEYVGEKQMLLVLDNCEHLIQGCAALADALLRGCSQLAMLVTSREGLRVPGETMYRVPPLSLPGPSEDLSPEHLLTFEAVQLFVERAHERRPDFSLTTANAKAVSIICRKLDGIPLAIELAAARIDLLTPEGIANGLDDSFQLLTEGPRTVLPRHQTLRATLDWSYDLLGNKEQALLRRLSVFTGGWTLEAAQAVCAGDLSVPVRYSNGWPTNINLEGSPIQSEREAHPNQANPSPRDNSDTQAEDCSLSTTFLLEEEALDLLGALVNKSLVLVHHEGQAARYRLLDTVRQYARERLDSSGEAALISDRHLSWYQQMAARAEQGLAGAEQAEWLSNLEREHDNLREALSWSRQPERQVAGMELALHLMLFWEQRGHLTEARQWLNDLLERANTVPAKLVARAMQCSGSLAGIQGDYAHAAELLEASLALQRELGDTQGIAMSLQALGYVTLYQGNASQAVALHEENVALRRKIGDPWGIAAALGNLGYAVYMLGDYDQATTLHQESLALRRMLENKHGIAVSLNDLGLVAWGRRDLEQAAALHAKSLAIRRYIGDKEGIAGSLANLAEVTAAQGDHDRATALLRESLALAQELGNKQVIACCLEGLAATAAATGVPWRAAELFGAAEALRERIGSPLPPSTQGDYYRSTAAVSAALGKEGLDSVWSRARRLSLEEAVSIALLPARRPTTADEHVGTDTPVR